jgi:uncharacterized protein YukE
MSIGASADTIIEAVASIEGVASHIEDTFAQVGNQLGRGHAMFQELNGNLAALSGELSGAKTEGASVALQDIASRLNELADALPAESALLGSIGKSAAEVSSLLKPLFKQIQMITIIARSARIEAASLDANRDSFIDFTREAFDLAKAVQHSVERCTQDQELLSGAVETALNKQKDFENLYRARLLSVGADLISAYSGMKDQQSKSVHLADLTSASTKRIAEAVGSSIISLQAGDSTRQRLEHIGHGLRIAAGSDASIVRALDAGTDAGDVAQTATLICQLQAAQLKDALSEFDTDIGQIGRSLKALLVDATDIVGHGRSLYGGEGGDTSSFLAVIKQTLAQASVLIGTCETAGKSVDEALSVVEDSLGKFRHAISGLSEAVVDIILVGMNASLKAGHLGVKGSAFVVIADELKATADQVSNGASRLKPILDSIERSANDLKQLRVDGDPTQLAKLEPSILHAIREIEAGNEQLGQLMNRLVHDGAQFEGLMTGAQALMSALGDASATLPDVATRLESIGATLRKVSLAPGDEVVLNDLLAHYTMAREREVHGRFLQRFGLICEPAPRQSQEAPIDDGVLFF